MTSPGVTALPIKGGHSDTETHIHVDMEAEFGERLPQAEECQALPYVPGSWERGWTRLLRTVLSRNQPADIVVLDFPRPGL